MSKNVTKSFRMTESENKILEKILKTIEPGLKKQGISGININLILRALIRLGADVSNEQLYEKIKEAKIFV